MTNPPMWWRRAEFSRRAVRWLGMASLLAFAPKCVLCVFAYAGLGAWLGLGGPEICGAPTDASPAWPSGLAACGLGMFGLLIAHCVKGLKRSAPLKVSPVSPPANPRTNPAETNLG